MPEQIIIKGIETNNLKAIDFSIKKKAINLIIGPSGSGKSSLAYDTVAQIGQHEFMTMFADDVAEPSYRVNSYTNMIAAIPIKQSNYNNNLHSTIGTYFGLNRSIAFIFAAILKVREDTFTLNRVGNLCEHCHGLGYTHELDINRIIDYNVPLAKNPIRSWNRYKDFYAQIISQYCTDLGIDPMKTFRDLSAREKEQILYGVSEKKYSIRYKKTNAFSRKTTKYYGPMTMKPMIVGFMPSTKYFSDIECSYCHGRKYSQELEAYSIHGLSIGAFMTLPFSDLILVLNSLKRNVIDQQIIFALNTICSFVEKAIELNLGHLYFHRSIPTLSGGELQRLKMVQVFNSQLTDLMIVLDEPLAGLSGDEKLSVYRNVLELANKHTILIVDHSDIFVNDASIITALGPVGGSNGGYVIDYRKYLSDESADHAFKAHSPDGELKVNIHNSVYHYCGASVSVLKGGMNYITGASGIGKSTLLREYFPQAFESYLYINQKPLIGNKNSSVITALDIFGRIQEMYGRITGKDKKLFSNLTGNDGACPYCGGAGYVEYGYDNRTKVRIACEECEGTGLNPILKKYKVKDKSMFDVWNMTIDEACEFFCSLEPKVTKLLKEASSIMLGHLRLGQPTSSLSGGENIRIKIMKAAKSSAQILGIDEPFRGLGSSEIYKVSLFLNELASKGKTVVVVDHSEIAERYFCRKIILVNRDGVLFG